MNASLSGTLTLVSEIVMEILGLYVLYRFWLGYRASKDRNLLLMTLAFLVFLIADITLLAAANIFGVALVVKARWHEMVVNALLIILILVIIRGTGWRGKVEDITYSFKPPRKGAA